MKNIIAMKRCRNFLFYDMGARNDNIKKNYDSVGIYIRAVENHQILLKRGEIRKW